MVKRNFEEFSQESCDNQIQEKLQENELQEKKIKPNYVIDKTWNSPSQIHNYMLDDPIIDYFKYSNFSPNFSQDSSNQDSSSNNFEKYFFNFITMKGNVFENKVINYIKNKLNIQVAQVSFSQSDIPSISKFNETIELMTQGVPIIYQGVLHNPEKKIYGSPDLIIRSDYLNKLVDSEVITNNDSEITSLFGNYHYRIIDIKYCMLHLRADGIHLLNSGRMKANKGQIIIYNDLLGSVQGYLPKQAYVFGRGYTYTCCGNVFESDKCDSKLGTIDISFVDRDIVKKVNEGLKWLTDVKTNGHKWEIKKGIQLRKELYPNMSNKFDFPYHSQKSQIAKEIGELTQIWNIGYAQRLNAHEHGIYSIDDPELDSMTLGLNQDGSKAEVIDKIIDINFKKKKSIIQPKRIKNNDYNWKHTPKLEFYIDIELINNIVDDFNKIPFIGFKTITFMIGLIIKEQINTNEQITKKIKKNNKTKTKTIIKTKTITKTTYVNFLCKDLTNESEKEMFNQFHEYVKSKCKEHHLDPDDVNFYHYGNIEKSNYTSILNKYNQPKKWNNGLGFSNFCDIYNIFKNEPITIKGSLDFSLKTIGKSMIEHNLIQTDLWETGNGLEAMIVAYNCYKDNNFEKMNDIIKYNEVDCRMLEKIIDYLRKNHL